MSQAAEMSALNRFLQAMLNHRFLLATTIIYMTVTIVIALHCGGTPAEIIAVIKFYFPGWYFYVAMIPLFPFFAAFFHTSALHPGRRWPTVLLRRFDDELKVYMRGPLLMNGLVAMLVVLPLIVTFCISKSLIPSLVPYYADPALAALDKTLHFGHVPADFFVGLSGHTLFLQGADWSYIAWFVAMTFANGYAFFYDQQPARRRCYLWAVTLSWIIPGTILATLIASAGPLFYGDFYPQLPNPYAALTAQLQAADAQTPLLEWQASRFLLALAHNGHVVNINAISAMPSMHVAISFLIALYAWKIWRPLGCLALFYTLVIMAASIVLGYHYAVDGYAAILITWALWVICERLTKEPAT